MIILYVGLSNTASPDYSQVRSFLLLPQLLCVRSLARALSLLLAQTTFHQNTDGSLIPGHLFTIKRKFQILLFHKTCRKANEGFSLILIFPVMCAWKKKLNVKSWFRNMHKTEFFHSSIRSWKRESEWWLSLYMCLLIQKCINYPTETWFPKLIHICFN